MNEDDIVLLSPGGKHFRLPNNGMPYDYYLDRGYRVLSDPNDAPKARKRDKPKGDKPIADQLR